MCRLASGSKIEVPAHQFGNNRLILDCLLNEVKISRYSINVASRATLRMLQKRQAVKRHQSSRDVEERPWYLLLAEKLGLSSPFAKWRRNVLRGLQPLLLISNEHVSSIADLNQWLSNVPVLSFFANSNDTGNFSSTKGCINFKKVSYK